MPIIAYRPPDPYHPYRDDWESTEVESDPSLSDSEVLEREGKRCGTTFLEFPPSKERAERYAMIYENYIPASAYATTSPPPLPAFNHPAPASPGSSNDDSASSEAPCRNAKRSREQETESSGSESNSPRKSKRPKRSVFRSIWNTLSIASSSAPHPPAVVEASPSPAPAPHLVAAPTPTAAAALRCGQRRTVQDLQQVIKTKVRPANDNSHVCQVNGCLTPLLAEDMDTARKHIAQHYVATGSLVCLRPGCLRPYRNLTSLVRHFETHLPWIYPCPNAARCGYGPFTRADVQKRHINMCEYGG